jgi:carboxypeptidase D
MLKYPHKLSPQPIFFLVLAATLSTAMHTAAQVEGLGAGPRAGTVYELNVWHADSGAVAGLSLRGYDVDALDVDGAATIYATSSEWEALIDAGFEVRIAARRRPAAQPGGAKGLGSYSTYASLTADLQAYAAAHPDIAELTSLGQSVQGRELWALSITDNPGVEEDEPEFRYASTIHGNEQLGTEMCLYLIDTLLNGYGADTRVTQLIDSTAISIVPMINPDGRELGTRYNANAMDLNRSFPDYPGDYLGMIFDGEPLGDAGRQPEVAHMMRWSAENSFVLSANLHGGALVVNYPYDHEPGIPSGVAALSPDEDLMHALSLTYATHNPEMFASPIFANGVTNGSEWYALTGGMQDWNYRYLGCIDFTIELSNSKMPLEASLPDFWDSNEESMLSYIESVHTGLRGVITDAATGEPVYAQVTIEGNTQPVFSDPGVGDYYRLLLPGLYTVTVDASGYAPQTISGLIVETGSATRLNFELSAQRVPGASPWALATLTLILIALFAIRQRPDTALRSNRR